MKQRQDRKKKISVSCRATSVLILGIIAFPERRRENGNRNFEKLMDEIFPNIIKTVKSYVQEAQ